MNDPFLLTLAHSSNTGITLVYLILLAGIFIPLGFLQFYLSKKKNAWLGLILPGFFVIFSLIGTFAIPAGSMLFFLIFSNTPTFLYLCIYIIGRKKKKRLADLEKMELQDL